MMFSAKCAPHLYFTGSNSSCVVNFDTPWEAYRIASEALAILKGPCW